MKRIFLLEDDVTLGSGVALALRSEDRALTLCRTLREAQTVELVLILDINLPDGSGLVFLQQVRQTSSVPIILLTANDMELDIVTGLEAGADDYITKPFSLAVLRARVNAQLRRSLPEHSGAFELGVFRFDFDRMEFIKEGRPVELSKTEQKLLRLLVENRGQTVPRGTLIDRVWTDGAVCAPRA